MLGIPSKDGGYLNISHSKLQSWKEKYDCDVENEIQKAVDWLESNESRRPKTLRFMENWLSRARPVKGKTLRKTVPESESQHPALRAERNRGIEHEIKRASEDTVQATLSHIHKLLAEKEVLKPEEKPAPHRHEFTECRYNGMPICKCGMFRHQFYQPPPRTEYAHLTWETFRQYIEFR